MPRRERTRDDRDFDTTSLGAKFHGKNLARDYSAHFFRWSFARRFVNNTDRVLEVGCGVEKPLANILLRNGVTPQVDSYVGVDLNPLKDGGVGSRAVFRGEFDFTTRWRELLDPARPFDVVVHLEVIEHMKVEHGRKLLRGAYGVLRPGGKMIMSTPVYDGKRHAANHIHEYTVPELQKETERAGFEVVRRFGTFMDVKHLRKMPGLHASLRDGAFDIHAHLAQYFDNHALSCFFAPLFPDYARNNLWLCQKPR